jgi:rubrerythrin
MDHQFDYDRQHEATSDSDEDQPLKDNLQLSLAREEEMMRTYLIMAERVHDNEELKIRLREFAEGNAKRSRQLIDELTEMD